MAVGIGGNSPAEGEPQNDAYNDSQAILEEQKECIKDLLMKTLNKGETWYLVDSKWLKQWKKYVGYESWEAERMGLESMHPGPIDNSGLFQDNNFQKLKKHLIDELDYALLPTKAWEKLASWYGICEGQTPIARQVVEHGMFVKHCKVEVYLVELRLCQYKDLEDWKPTSFSRADTIGHVETTMRKKFDISEDKDTRLWNKYMSNTYELLSRKDQTIQDCGLYNGQLVVLEEKNEDGSWTKDVNRSSTFSSSSLSTSPIESTFPANSPYSSHSSAGGYSSYYNEYNARESPSLPGLCGLSNLGNTCFMNSAVQCLSNCVTLTKFFVNDCYKSELNIENPLGMHGEIAKAYAGLMHQMWSGKYSVISPRQFKTAVGRFAPQFSGYQQQDSQELMAFLLDGLHEDLNRIKKKPYVELKDADGRPDEVVAQELWQAHRRRNDSIIVDFFHGQFKSTLTCPDCSKVSITFDPFCYLSLPLPVKKERLINVFFISRDPMVLPMEYRLTVPKRGTVKDLTKAMRKENGVSEKHMFVVDVYNHRFHKIFALSDSLNNIIDRDDIFIYEVPDQENNDVISIPVYLREKKQSGYSASSNLFGKPFFVTVDVDSTTYEELYDAIVDKMRRFITVVKENGNSGIKNDDEVQNNETEEERNDTMEETNDKMEDESSSEVKSESSNCKGMPVLFTMCTVNSYGSAEIDHLKDDGKPLNISPRSYVAVDWYPKMRSKYYDEKKAEEMRHHESVDHKLHERKLINLDDCINLFLNSEKLSADDPWYCPSCKEHRQATKKFDLWTLPKILIIHLKRFSYNRFWRDKLDIKVDFPLTNLDMSKHVMNKKHPSAIYDLHAVSNHFGGLGGGHYTAFCKNPNGQWYDFDDSSVTSMSKERVVSSSAYLLCYTRRDDNSNSDDLDDQRMECEDESPSSTLENNNEQCHNSIL
ncbi:ubiquitin carboxyl-terminal hydrolase 4-like [Xenia sp. Carnegie-2017]|uniref:ubiquitin carboxyl-terminal hydrolase 4-like n=1 Tax=Xenia sp. Carnegie-2017 TaxID=2897299 RepID=UPI001F0497E1|nr:ubiquitin carboxyl-terminal hydrolase 4-like [Xenia sp. Carnegie-2017]